MKIDVKELGDYVPFMLNGRSVTAIAAPGPPRIESEPSAIAGATFRATLCVPHIFELLGTAVGLGGHGN